MTYIPPSKSMLDHQDAVGWVKDSYLLCSSCGVGEVERDYIYHSCDSCGHTDEEPEVIFVCSHCKAVSPATTLIQFYRYSLTSRLAYSMALRHAASLERAILFGYKFGVTDEQSQA